MLASTVREAAERFGDLPAFVAADGWPLSFAALDRLSDEAAVGLAARGVGEGDLVALALPSTPDYVVAYAALAKLGAIGAGVNPRSTPSERSAVLEVAQPALVLASPPLVEGVPVTIPVEIVDLAAGVGGLLATIRAGHEGTAPPVLADDPDRLVTVVFTSGTTGVPKGAMFGERELMAVAVADTGGGWAEPGTSGGAMLSGTQLAHIGFMTKLPWYLRRAMTVHLIDRWRAADVLRMISDERMASIGGVAPQLALLLRVPDFDAHDLSHVKTIVMGGALSPPALVHEARARIGAAYSIRYSSTESGGVGTATAFDADEDEALLTVGRPRAGVEIEIRDEDDHVLPSGQIGEICLRSPTQLRGYWRAPDATAATIRGGWVHSGDLGFIDEAGCLRLAGRAKEMYIRGGYNVYPLEVEAVLASHPDVVEVVVTPRPDPVMGEIGVAVVVPRDPQDPPTLDELRAYAGEKLSAHKLPEDLRFVDELPLTPMQKIDRNALAAHEQQQAGMPG
ncbi:MAG: class I adenylate-forming enzyme family protein [Acidimicrobiales bacterium]